jgi:hypothetical protein
MSLIDCTIVFVILLLAFEQLRITHFYNEPLRALCFILLCAGGFARIMWATSNHDTHWWTISMHAGFMLYGVRNWSQKFQTQRADDREKFAVSTLRRTL